MHYGKRFTKVDNKFLIFPMHEIESFFAYLDLCSPASAMALFSNFASN